MGTCKCWECKLEQRHGSLDEVPDSVVLAAGGCPYCAMTGFEDYPTNQKACRYYMHRRERPRVFPTEQRRRCE
jgi:hypothetical protein